MEVLASWAGGYEKLYLLAAVLLPVGMFGVLALVAEVLNRVLKDRG
jgi:hypothetical protein